MTTDPNLRNSVTSAARHAIRITRSTYVDVMVAAPDLDAAIYVAREYGYDSEWQPEHGWDGLMVTAADVPVSEFGEPRLSPNAEARLLD